MQAIIELSPVKMFENFRTIAGERLMSVTSYIKELHFLFDIRCQGFIHLEGAGEEVRILFKSYSRMTQLTTE